MVIVGDKGLDKAKPYLGDRYYDFNYRLIWWPRETYKDLTWQRIWDGIRDPVQRGQFWDVVLHRRYTTPTADWESPYVHFFHLFVRKDVGGQVWRSATPKPQRRRQRWWIRTWRGSGRWRRWRRSGRRVPAGPGRVGCTRRGRWRWRADGTVYVADAGNNRVEVFGADGSFVREWGGTCKLIEKQPGLQRRRARAVQRAVGDRGGGRRERVRGGHLELAACRSSTRRAAS